MKTTPTTFELARLAAQLQPNPKRARDSIRHAMSLWHEAEVELEQYKGRHDYLNQIAVSVYTDTPDEWKVRIEAYPGDQSDVNKKLGEEVPSDSVHRQLFKDKSLAKEQRKRLFVGLLKAAQSHRMPPPPMRNWTAWPVAEKVPDDAGGKEWAARINESAQENVDRAIDEMRKELVAETLPLTVVRWAVQVRQKQLATSKSRVIPASLKQRRR